jgi:hypothetical protein
MMHSVSAEGLRSHLQVRFSQSGVNVNPYHNRSTRKDDPSPSIVLPRGSIRYRRGTRGRDRCAASRHLASKLFLLNDPARSGRRGKATPCRIGARRQSNRNNITVSLRSARTRSFCSPFVTNGGAQFIATRSEIQFNGVISASFRGSPAQQSVPCET